MQQEVSIIVTFVIKSIKLKIYGVDVQDFASVAFISRPVPGRFH